MGVVWKAADTVLDRTVAIKVLPADLVPDEERREMFLKEAKLAASVSHAHIVQVHEFGREGDLDFIVMEHVEGKPLHKILHGRPLPPDKLAEFGVQIAQGLARAHRKNLIHRDLKPANVLVTPEGDVKIVDFGLATLFASPEATTASLATTLTESPDDKPTAIAGTLPYMSPEQVRGEKLDARSDIFSFGSVLYEMTTGQRPFGGAKPADVASAILSSRPTPVHELVPEVPLDLYRIVEKALARRPEDRYQHMDDMVVDLKRLSKELESGSSPSYQSIASITRAPAPFWKKPAFVGAAIVVILLTVFGLSRLFRGDGVSVSPAAANSIAVFSFENIKDPDDPDRLGQILQELVITDLSEIDAVKVLSSQRLYDVQRQIGKERRLDKDHITEVAVKAGAGRMLSGTLSQLGEKWILAAQLVDVGSGEVVASKRIDGEDLYTMVDALTVDLQSGLQLEVHTEIEPVPVKNKTTQSLDAFKHYLAGVEHLSNHLFVEAEKELRQAIEIDPDFGQAYYKLALCVGWSTWDLSNNPHEARAIIETLLSRKLYNTEKERRMAEALSRMVDDRWGEAREIYEQLTQDYPDEKEAWHGLGEALWHSFGGGREKEALVAFKRAIALDPDFRLPLHHVFDAYQLEKMFDEAMAHAKSLIERDPTDAAYQRYHAVAVTMQGSEKAVEAAVQQALVHNVTPEEKKRLYQEVHWRLRARGEIESAHAYLRKAAEASPDDVASQLQLAGFLFEERRLDEYDAAIFEGLKRHPDHYGFQSDARAIWRRRGEWQTAAAIAESLAVANPDDRRAARDWIWYTEQTGGETKKARAMAQAERLHTTLDEKRALYLAQAGAYASMGDHFARRAVLERILDLTPDPDPDLCNAFTWCHWALRKIQEMRSWHAKAEAGNPRHGGMLAAGVYLNVTAGEHEMALAYAERIGEKWPKSVFYYQYKTFALVRAGKIDAAEAVIDEAMNTLATPDEKYRYLAGRDTPVALAFITVEDWKRAEAACREAIAIDPAPRALNRLSLIRTYQGNLNGAEREVRRGLRRAPGNIGLRARLAWVHFQNGETEQAWEIWNSLAETGFISVTRLFGQSCVLLEEGRYEEALPLLERTAAMLPQRAALDLLAWVLVSRDLDVERGADVARQALEDHNVFDVARIRPYRPPAEETLGLVAMKRKQYSEAVTWFEKAAEVNPNRPSIQESLKQARARATGSP